MKRCFGVLLAMAVCLGGCDEAPAPKPEAKKVSPAGVDKGDAPETAVQVTIASVPAGASVTLDGAELGKTPYALHVKDDTEVGVALAGYEPQTLEVEPDGEPNVVVKLVALEGAAAQPGAAELPTDAAGEPAAAAEPAAAKVEAKPKAKPKAPRYSNVAKAKAAYNGGKIDKVRYNQIIKQLKTKRKAKLEKLDAIYESGKIDKVERNRRKKVIDSAYKGS